MKKNFTEIGANIGGKIDSRINKTKEFVKEHKKKILIIGGTALVVGATGVGATAVYFGGKKLEPMPEQIPESVEQEDENDSVVTLDSESSQEVPEE